MLLFAAVLIFNLALPCALYNFDGLVFSAFIRHALYLPFRPELLHDHHILYGPLGYLTCWPLVALGFDPDVRTILAMLGAVAGAAAAWALYRAVRVLGLCPALALPVALLLPLARAFWRFSTDPEVYVFSVLVLLLGVPLFVRMLRDEAATPARIWSGAVLGLALGFHLSHVLFLPAFLYAHLATGRPRRFRALAGALAGAMAFLPYVAKFILFPETNSIAAGLRGVLRPAAVADAGYWSWPAPILEFGAVIGAFTRPERPGFGAASAAIGAAIIVWLGAAILLGRAAGDPERRIRRFLWLWWLPYFAFFSIWDAGNAEFALFQLTPLLLLLGLGARAIGDRTGRANVVTAGAWILVACLGISNTLSTFLPLADPAANRDLAVSRFVTAGSRPDDLIVIVGRGDETDLKAYLPYFSGREILILDFWFNHLMFPNDEGERRVRERLRAVAGTGGSVFVTGGVWRDGALGEEFETRHQLPQGYLAGLFGAMQPERAGEGPGSFALYRLTAPAAIAAPGGGVTESPR